MKERLQPPSPKYWFGTDEYGRDVFARILWGTRISLFVGLFTVALAMTVGSIIGALAGYYGGRMDNVLMRIMDVFLAMPGTILAVAIVGALGPGIINVLLAMSIFRIPQFARIVRSSVISIRDQEFIEAAKACGTKDRRIILRHILPNAVGPLWCGHPEHGDNHPRRCRAELYRARIEAPIPEWGSMLSATKSQMRYQPYLMIFRHGHYDRRFVAQPDWRRFEDALDPRMKTKDGKGSGKWRKTSGNKRSAC